MTKYSNILVRNKKTGSGGEQFKVALLHATTH